jgi:RimJ/RimL family protein N-acetyltransferase
MSMSRVLPSDPFQATWKLETAAGPICFRPIRPGDESELLAFFRDRLSPRSQYLFCPHDPTQPERCLEQFAERISRHMERRDIAFIVERQSAVLGYFYLAGVDRADGQAPTLGIGLADEFHGHHMGGAMMDHLLACACALGIRQIELTHESTNERASRLYQSRGFAYTGEEERSGPDGGRVERVMRWNG